MKTYLNDDLSGLVPFHELYREPMALWQPARDPICLFVTVPGSVGLRCIATVEDRNAAEYLAWLWNHAEDLLEAVRERNVLRAEISTRPDILPVKRQGQVGEKGVRR